MSSIVAFVTYVYKNQDKLRVQLRNMQGSRQMTIKGADVEAQTKIPTPCWETAKDNLVQIQGTTGPEPFVRGPRDHW